LHREIQFLPVNNDAPPGSPTLPWWRRPAVWLALVIAAYGGGYLIWYLGTPLGRAPQLDGRENLALAAQIADGTLPREPFYRAMLYPGVLTVPLLLGWSTESLPTFAAIFGLLCHFAATLAVAQLAAQLWAGLRANWAARVAAGLWGLNPVALFYAVDVLDITLALALFLCGWVFLIRSDNRPRPVIIGGLLLGLAVAARPNFLPAVIVAPLARAWWLGHGKPRGMDLLGWAGAAMSLLALGFGQWAWAGEFRILPWQGAYNFYAANTGRANGRYYTQEVFLGHIPPGENSARLVSQYLYTKTTGAQPPYSIAAMDGYWRAQATSSLSGNPGAWLRLLARKAYYLANDFDQYNNKTYAWHQGQSPWLRWNPLGWGLMLVLAAGALPLALTYNRSATAGVLVVFFSYGAGVLLYYASGRFRLPLTPWLCVLAGGWVTLHPISSLRRPPNAGCLLSASVVLALAAGFLSFSNFLNARDHATFIQDEMLVASAATDVGEDALALAYAQRALDLDPARPDARRLFLLCSFNLALAGVPGADTPKRWEEIKPLLNGLETNDASLSLIAGVVFWKTGDITRAEQIWQAGAQQFGPSSAPAQALLAALTLRGAAPAGAPLVSPDFLRYLQNRSP
jgi:hypothetical protein